MVVVAVVLEVVAALDLLAVAAAVVEIVALLLQVAVAEMVTKPIIFQVEVAVALALLATEFLAAVMVDKVDFMAAAVAKARLLQVGLDQVVLVAKELYVLFGDIIFYGTFCINRRK
jgi:hypothetical protein